MRRKGTPRIVWQKTENHTACQETLGDSGWLGRVGRCWGTGGGTAGTGGRLGSTEVTGCRRGYSIAIMDAQLAVQRR
jgi:hypothetical protein